MKVAVIGRGFGSYAMQPAFEARGWEVTLVPSRDAEGVAAACRQDFDLISVHSPPFQHREHVLRALEAGRDVLCDKPFGKTAAEAREMRDAAKAAGVLHFLNFEFRQGPSRAKVKQLIDAGEIGAVSHINYTMFANMMRGRDFGWLFDAAQGGGWLGAMGSHIVDAARWMLASEVSDCGGVFRIDLPSRADGAGGMASCTAEDAFAIWLRMANGATVTIDSASCANLFMPPRMQFLGRTGILELTGDTVITLNRHKAESQVWDFAPKEGDLPWPAIHGWIALIEGALAGRTQLEPNFDDGVATAEVLEQLKARAVWAGRE